MIILIKVFKEVEFVYNILEKCIYGIWNLLGLWEYKLNKKNVV